MTNTFQVQTEAKLTIKDVEVHIVGQDSFIIKCKGVSTFGDLSSLSVVEVNIPASMENNRDLALHVDMFIKAITKTLEKE